MKVVLDIVVNHLCDDKTKYSRQPSNRIQCTNDLDGRNWSGEPGAGPFQGELAFSEDFFGPFKSQFFFSRCGANSFEETSSSGSASIFGDFVSVMFDFDTRNYEFQKIFTDIHKYWIAYADLDGYRLDAAKHVTEDFIAYFSTEIRDYANRLGKNNFFLVGEVAGSPAWQGRRLGIMFSNPFNPDQHGTGNDAVPKSLTSRMWQLKDTYLRHPNAAYPGLNAIYDFQLSGTTRDIFLGKSPSNNLDEWIHGQGFQTCDKQNDMRLAWTNIEIHDWPRFLVCENNSVQEK
jgi:glycosidase